nr:DUF3302 domain-containing protein [Bosea psychrotolerans]
MLDIFAWLVLVVLLFSTIAVVVLLAMLPGMIARRRGHDAAFADALPAGSVGDAAIFTERVQPAHLIRRIIAILNYVNPF